MPDVGGRVLQFWLGAHPFLFVTRAWLGRLFTPAENWGDGTMSSWKNYGGAKTWPAAQGWSGPAGWHVDAALGVFEAGRIQLRPGGAADVLLEQAATPLAPVIPDHELQLPEGARSVDLVLVRDMGQPVLLGRASVDLT